MVENQMRLLLDYIHKNSRKSNFVRWIRSAAVMEAYFPRKYYPCNGGCFVPGGVVCSTKSP